MSEAWKIDDDEIERVARRYCFALGLDPDERVGHDYLATMTPGEIAADTSTVVPMRMGYSPRWTLHRSTAAGLIAGQLALGENVILTATLTEIASALKVLDRWTESDEGGSALFGYDRKNLSFDPNDHGRYDQSFFDAEFNERA